MGTLNSKEDEMSAEIGFLVNEFREQNLIQTEREQDLGVMISEFWDFLAERGLVEDFKKWVKTPHA